MKRLILIAVLVLSLSGTVLAQLGFGSDTYCRPSEIKPNNIGSVYSAETYLQKLQDTCGIDVFYHVLRAIEDNSIDGDIQKLENLGNAYSKQYIRVIKNVRAMVSNKTCFIADGIFYIMTYKLVSDTSKIKEVYLYGRNHVGWFQASNLIRKDYLVENDSIKYFKINVINIPTTRYRIRDNIMVLVTKTVERHKRNGMSFTIHNTITVFTSIGDGKYSVAHYEPKEKIEFDVNQLHADFPLTDNKFKLTNEFGTIIFEIDGGKLIYDESSTIKLEKII